jgi:hypothetical protein
VTRPAQPGNHSATPREILRIGSVAWLQWTETSTTVHRRAGAAEQAGATVEQRPMNRVTEVAACTMEAAHRRDHHHGLGAEACHPHAVEVVHLGHRAVCVCHDCRLDTGFLPRREAEALAAGHRVLTRDVSVRLLTA